MIVSPFELIGRAQAENYAIGAFNFYNLDTMMAILQAAEQEKSPVILQIYAAHFTFYSVGSMIAAAALEAASRANIPVALHLDHSDQYATVVKAISCGFQSVMYDGSSHPLIDNIATTAKVVEIAHFLNIYTEAEIGRILRIGTDDYETESISDCATVEDCVRLIEETHVDSLAPAYGTAHGIYHTAPVIQFDRLKAISDAVRIPLVLHGGSGIPDEMIQKAVAQCGVRKVNVGTELKYRWADTMRASLDDGVNEPIALGEKARTAAAEIAAAKMRLFGSSGKA